FAAVPSADVLAPPSSTAEILYAGRLSAEKGVDVLLDAFARVVAGHPDARLVVAGDGPDRQALLARAAHTSGVEFTGVLERPDLEARMGRARAVVVPSLGAEGGPVVGVEGALADGRGAGSVPPGGGRPGAGSAARRARAGRGAVWGGGRGGGSVARGAGGGGPWRRCKEGEGGGGDRRGFQPEGPTWARP